MSEKSIGRAPDGPGGPSSLRKYYDRQRIKTTSAIESALAHYDGPKTISAFSKASGIHRRTLERHRDRLPGFTLHSSDPVDNAEYTKLKRKFSALERRHDVMSQKFEANVLVRKKHVSRIRKCKHLINELRRNLTALACAVEQPRGLEPER